MTKTLILPVAGRSSRYIGRKPKWLLTHPRGTLVLTEAIRGINPSQFDTILIIALESLEQDYKFSEALVQEFETEYNLKKENLKIVLLKRDTKSQSETVYEGIKQAKITGSIFVKDSDNYFSLEKIPSKNFVATWNLQESGPIILTNKSYVKINETDTSKILDIVENKIVSNYFCCGGYSFSDSAVFCKYFEKLKNNLNLYLSKIVQQMISEKEEFSMWETKNFEDWGTLWDWRRFKQSYATMFIELDGVVVLNSTKHFSPRWGSTEALRRNVSTLNRLYESGKVEIIIISSRSEEFKEVTIEQLKKNSVKYHRIIFGLPTDTKRLLISPFSDTNQFPSAIAVNMKIDEDRLDDFIKSGEGSL